MKKLISFALALFLVCGLASCGSSSQLGDNNERTAKSIINAVDAYLDGESDIETAYAIVAEEYENIDEDDNDGTSTSKAAITSFDVSTLCLELELSRMRYNEGSVSNIKEYRNEIAELIGVSKYK